MADKKEKGPQDLRRGPSKPAKDAPAHVRVGEHGIRTTARFDARDENGNSELEKEANAEARAEDYKRSERSTGAGPNPYKLESVGDRHRKVVESTLETAHKGEGIPPWIDPRSIAAHAEASAESKAEDAQVVTPGETITDTGQKIVTKPDRIAADEKAELPNIAERHKAALKDASEDPNERRQILLHEEALRTSGKDELSADKNVGALYGDDQAHQPSYSGEGSAKEAKK